LASNTATFCSFPKRQQKIYDGENKANKEEGILLKRLSEIIRELLEEDAFVRSHEPEILRFYVERASAPKKRAQPAANGPAGAPAEICPNRIPVLAR
jgi:hypothetical protein